MEESKQEWALNPWCNGDGGGGPCVCSVSRDPATSTLLCEPSSTLPLHCIALSCVRVATSTQEPSPTLPFPNFPCIALFFSASGQRRSAHVLFNRIPLLAIGCNICCFPISHCNVLNATCWCIARKRRLGWRQPPILGFSSSLRLFPKSPSGGTIATIALGW